MFKNMKLSAKMLFGAKELSSPSDSSFTVQTRRNKNE